MDQAEHSVRTSLITAIAPVTWGSTYFVTAQFLPPGHPLWGGVIRALPAGLLLVAIRRELPKGDWWWRTALLGTLTIGLFFALIYFVALRLPSGLASTLMATSPIVLMLLAWPVLAERPQPLAVLGGLAGFLGVGLLVLEAPGGVDWLGVAAALLAMVLAQIGFVLTKKWRPPVADYTFAGWQLTAGGLVLVPLALVFEGAPPALTGTNLLAFGYLSLIATGIAYVAWLTGLHHLPAGTVGLIGLLNPVTGVLLGVALAGEHFGLAQWAGLALVLGGVLLGQPAVQARLGVGTARGGSGPDRTDHGEARGIPTVDERA